MATTTTGTPKLTQAERILELEKRLAQFEQVRTTLNLTPAQYQLKVPTWLGVLNIATIITIVLAIAGFAYYLGGLNNTVTTTSTNVSRLNDAVIGTTKESLSSRVAVIETRTAAIESKIDAIDKKLNSQ